MSPMLRHPVFVTVMVLLALTALSAAIGAPIGLITQIAIYTLYGAGVCLLVSYTGLVPFGASVFFGCASYAVAFAMLRGAGNEIVALVFGVVFSLILAAIIAAISCSNQLGAVESGWTAAWLGPVTSVWGGGLATLAIAALCLFLSPALRKWKQ